MSDQWGTLSRMEKPRQEALKEIAVRVRQRRAERGLTQEELAHLAGVSKSFVSEIEAGTRGASGLKYLALAEALEVEVQWLLTGREKPVAQTQPPVIPPEVSQVAESEGWSHKLTLDVATVLQGLVARRTRGGHAWKPNREYILRVARAIQEAEES